MLVISHSSDTKAELIPTNRNIQADTPGLHSRNQDINAGAYNIIIFNSNKLEVTHAENNINIIILMTQEWA